MRTKVTLVLLFLNVALFFFIFWFERDWQTGRALRVASSQVLGPETAGIQALEISGPALPQTVSLVRQANSDAWQLTRPHAWAAYGIGVKRIISELQGLKNKGSWSVADLEPNERSLASYGLDQPRLTLKFTSAAGKSYSLWIGRDTDDGNSLYVLSPDGQEVHVVDRSLTATLTQSLEQLVDTAVFTIKEYEVSSLNLTPLVSPDTMIRRTGETWGFESPILARASGLNTRAVINDLNNLRLLAFVDTRPADAFPESGFSLRIKLEGNKRTEAVLLGNPVGPSANGATVYYAHKDLTSKDSGPTQDFTVSILDTLIETLRNAQTKLRERKILPDLDTQAVTAITIGGPDPVLDLQRFEVPTAAGDSRASWRLVMRNGGANAEPQPADGAAVQTLLKRLADLTALDFTSDAPQAGALEGWGLNRPLRRVTLTIAAPPRGQAARIELSIGRNATATRAFARINGTESVYELDPQIFLDLPEERNTWRDRVLRELTTGEQISSIALTELTTPPVVIVPPQSPPAATGTANSEAPLAALARQLRTLRAKAFVSDEFNTAEVAVAEGPRPWRYLLELTISQVGAATGSQSSTLRIYFTERLGTLQRAGSPGIGVWDMDQPLIDALRRVFEQGTNL